MSSRSALSVRGVSALVSQHELEDLVRQSATQGTICLPFGVAGGEATLEVVSTATRAPDLAHCDAVDGGVDLTITAAVEAVPLLVAGRGRNGRSAVVHSEVSAGAEATHVGGLPDELGCRKDPRAGERQGAGRKGWHHARQLLLELANARAQLRGPSGQLSSQLGDDPRAALEQPLHSPDRRSPAQRSVGNLESRLELVEQPLQSILYSSSLSDQVLAVVDKQPHFASVLLQMRLRQVGFTERCTSNGEGINSVRLAAFAHTATAFSGHMRWHPHHHFAGVQKISLQSPSHVAAVLDRPTTLWPTLCPAQDIEVARRCRSHSVGTELSARVVYGHQRMTLLVRVRSQCHHSSRLLFTGEAMTGRRTRLSWGKPISYRVTLAGLLFAWRRQVLTRSEMRREGQSQPPCPARMTLREGPPRVCLPPNAAPPLHLPRKMARRLLIPVPMRLQLRLHLRAHPRHPPDRTPRAEPAPRRRVHRRWDLPFDQHRLAPPLDQPIRHGNRRKQRLRLRVLRV